MLGPVPANGEGSPRALEHVSSLVASVSKDMIVLSPFLPGHWFLQFIAISSYSMSCILKQNIAYW